MCERDQAGRVGGETRPQYTPWTELTGTARDMVEDTALTEIQHFGATGNPDAIERLAVAGREVDGDDEARGYAWQVSDYMDHVAARIRERAVMALFGGLAQAHKLAIRA